MKKTLTKVISVLLAVFMLSACVVVANAATTALVIDSSADTVITYADHTFYVDINATKLGQIIDSKDPSKDDIVGYLPEGLYRIVRERSTASVVDFITDIADQSGNTKALLLDLVGGDKEVFKDYASYAELEAIISKDAVIAATDVAALVQVFEDNGTFALLLKNGAIKALVADKDLIPNPSAIAAAVANYQGITSMVTSQFAAYLGVTTPVVTLGDVYNAATIDNIISAVGGIDNFVNAIGGYEYVIGQIGMSKLANAVIANGLVSQLPIYDMLSCVKLSELKDDVSKAAIKDYLVNNVVRFLVNEVSDIQINGKSVYDAANCEFDHNALQTAILQAVPTAEDFATAGNGDSVFDFTLSISGSVNTYVSVKARLIGDTFLVNAYADRLLDFITFDVADDGKVTSDINVPGTFTELYKQFINTSYLDDERKLEYLEIYNAVGDELFDVLDTIDKYDVQYLCNEYNAKLGSAVSRVNDLLYTYNTYVTKLVNLFDTLKQLYGDIAASKSIADYYVGNGRFSLVCNNAEDVDQFIDRFATQYNLPAEITMLISPDPHMVNLDIDVQFKNFYRVRYYNAQGTLLYQTFMPAGVSLDLLTDNVASLTGKDWYEGNVNTFAMPAHDVDLYPTPGYTTYTVKFDANNADAEGIMFDQTILAGNAAYLYANNYEVEHYKFIGWNTKADGTGDAYADGESVTDLVPAGYSITLYAQWKKITHTATFVADGTTVDTVEFDEGDAALASEPNVPAKAHYKGEWEAYTVADKTSDFTVNAIYTSTQHNVTFVADGVTVGSVGFDEGDTALTSEPSVPNKAHYTGAWEAYTVADKTSDFTVNAIYTRIQHTVTFIADGKVEGAFLFDEGIEAFASVPAVPAKTGYSGAWAPYTVADKTADFNINAIYTANKYTVKFNANTGDGSMIAVTFTYDEPVYLPDCTFTKEGYNFVGWNTQADGKGTSYANKANVKNLVVDGEVTLYAIWESTTPTGDAGLTIFVILGVIALAGAAFFAVKMRRKVSVK